MATPSLIIFIQPRLGVEGQAVRVKIQIAPEFEGVIQHFPAIWSTQTLLEY